MLMICGAAFSLIAAWLALAEAGVPFRQNRWTKVVHFVAAWFVLAGLTAPLGEFRFGVPQFQQLFHPVLLMLAAAFAFVPTRLVLGRGWAVVLALAMFVPERIGAVSGAGSGFVPTRTPGLYITAAIAVEVAALLFGTDRRLRFAITSGIGVATIGLAGEWWWNQDAPQPWNGVLLRDALVVGGVVAIGAAVLGAVYAGAVLREPGRIPRVAAVMAAAVVLAGLWWPMPRRTSAVTAGIDVQPSGNGAVALTVHVEPPDAARNARWFQAIAWQGGGLKVVGLHAVAPGTYVSDGPVPVGGRWKTVLRLHTGAVLMSAPVYFPADPEIGAPEIPAQSRTIPFADEQQYLMREVTSGPNTVMVLAYVIVAVVAVAWAAAFVLACSRIPQRPPLRTSGTRRRSAPPLEREPEPVSR